MAKYTLEGLPVITRGVIQTVYRDQERMVRELGRERLFMDTLEKITSQDAFYSRFLIEGMRRAKPENCENSYGEKGEQGFLAGSLVLYDIFRRQEEVNDLAGSTRPRVIPCKVELPTFFQDIIDEMYMKGEDLEFKKYLEHQGTLDSIVTQPLICRHLNSQNPEIGKWILDIFQDGADSDDPLGNYAIFLGSLHTYEFLRRQCRNSPLIA